MRFLAGRCEDTASLANSKAAGSRRAALLIFPLVTLGKCRYERRRGNSERSFSRRRKGRKTYRVQSGRRTPMPRSRLPLARLVGVLALLLAAESARAQDFLDK